MKITFSWLLKAKFLIIGFIFSMMPAIAQSSSASAKPEQGMTSTQFTLLIILILLVVIVLMVLVLSVYSLMVMHTILLRKQGEKPKSMWSSIWNLLGKTMNETVPIEKEKTIVLDHNYDGIRELDHHLPPWWLYLFYGTAVFAIFYLFNYHIFKWSPLSEDEYKIAMAAKTKEVETYNRLYAVKIDEKNVEVSEDAADLTAGGEIWKNNCATCHGQVGQGGAGPNMTDDCWLYGGDVKGIFTTVKYGSPNNPAMVSWQGKLKPKQMQQVASFILKKLQGTKPADGKPCQGEKAE